MDEDVCLCLAALWPHGTEEGASPKPLTGRAWPYMAYITLTDKDTSSNKAREERIITIPKPENANADDDFGFNEGVEFL